MTERDGRLWKLFSYIPVLRRLKEVPNEALEEARAEIVSTTIFAAMPFWFPVLGYLILIQPPAILESLRNGELLIFAATLVGPLAYIVTKRYGKYVAPSDDPEQPAQPLTYTFPDGRQAVIAAMVICIISGVVVTLQKVQQLPLLSGIDLINNFGLALSSLIVLILAMTLLFCVSAFRNFMELLTQKQSDTISRAQSEQEADFAKAWRARKEEL